MKCYLQAGAATTKPLQSHLSIHWPHSSLHWLDGGRPTKAGGTLQLQLLLLHPHFLSVFVHILWWSSARMDDTRQTCCMYTVGSPIAYYASAASDPNLFGHIDQQVDWQWGSTQSVVLCATPGLPLNPLEPGSVAPVLLLLLLLTLPLCSSEIFLKRLSPPLQPVTIEAPPLRESVSWKRYKTSLSTIYNTWYIQRFVICN